MKKILAGIFSLIYIGANSQVLFSDSFNGLTLQNDVQVVGSITTTTTYTTAPASYNLINDGYKNNVGNTNSPNKPFNVASLKTTGWAVSYNSVEADTFLVTTSWLDTNAAVQRFIVSPVINSLTANSVLSWQAKSPDANFPEGYEVYVTTNTTGTLTAGDFTAAPVFKLNDGNTAGQGEKNVWTKRGVSLATYSGQNVRIAFKNISKNMYQLWIDDITVENIANANDAALSSSPKFYNYNSANTNGGVYCRVTNAGNNDITALNLSYQVIGATLSVPQGGTIALTPHAATDFSFITSYSITTPGYYKVKIWVNSVNSGSDSNALNDTINTYVCIVTSVPAKNTLVEQFVSATDGFSPDAQEKLKAVTSGSVIAINVHDNDSLTTTSAASLISTYRKTLSTAMIDRTFFTDVNSVPVSRTSYSAHINQRKSVIVPVSVSISNKNYDSASRVLTFTVSASFVGEVKGDYRMSAYLTENNIYGPVMDTSYNGWNQLSFMYNIPFSPYFQTGYYLPAQNGYVLKADQFKHLNVLDIALDGSFGAAGIIPTTGGTQGQTYTKAYSYIVPVSPPGQFRYIPENMYIVASVSEFDADQNKRTVLNCTQDKMISKSETFVSVKELAFNSEFVLYPNPSYGLTNVLIPENSFRKQITVSIIDVIGKEVYTQNSNMRFGLLQLNLYHLEAGTYFICLSDGETKSVKKLVITK